MLMKCRKRPRPFRNLFFSSFGVLAALFIAMALSRSPRAEDTPPVPEVDPSQPMGEEVDIFKQRTRELAKQERFEEKKRKLKPKPSQSFSNMFSLSPVAVTDVGDGMGMIGRASHLIGPTFGRSGSITPLEIMPYSLSDERFLFADIRGFITNSSQPGGSAGVGIRQLREDWNAWGGASLWYDADQSTSKLFHQVGVSLEGLIDRFELRSNLYFPISNTQTISNSIGGASIVGNQILFGRNILMGAPMRGVDGEFGYSLPIRERHVLRAFVGGYYFDSDASSSVTGFKARVEGVINNTFTAQALYTNDNLYGTNLMVGLTIQLPYGNRHPTSGWKQHTPSPFRFVERNYNVILAQFHNNAADQVAVDPATGLAYNVQQVYEPPPGSPTVAVFGAGHGTAAAPNETIAAAQAAGGNVIIVQGGSQINESVTLTSGQKLFGEGNYNPVLAVAGGGFIQVPIAHHAGEFSTSTQTPLFTGVNGTAITVASNTEVAGFKFAGSTGDGIDGTNATNVSLHDLTFLAAGGDAIHLTGSSGTVSLRNIQINGANGNGIVLDGGDANISYIGDGTSITSQGDGFILSNVTRGTVNIGNLTLKNTGGAGLRMSSVGTDVTLNNVNVTQSTGPAVAITGNTGTVVPGAVPTNHYNTYNFDGTTTITSPKASGFTVNGTDAIINVVNLNVTSTAGLPAVSLVNDPTSTITFNSMTLNTNNGTGLFAVGLDLLKINGGSITSMNAPAIDIQSSIIDTTFRSVSANGGLLGIGLTQSSGIFTIQGTGNYGTGGVIQNTTTGVKINSFGTANLNWIDFTANGTAIQSAKSAQLNLQNLRIGNSTNYAIDSMDDNVLTLRNSILATNGAIGGGTIRVQADTIGLFQSLISNNTITDANGTAIQYQTLPTGAGASLAMTIQSSTITGTRGGSPVIAVGWNGPESVSVSNNTIYVFGANSPAVRIQDSSTTDSMTAQVKGNTITFEPGASQGTGLSVIAASTSQLSISQNTIDFKATGGIGTRFALSGTSTDYIASNVITDEAGGATGMLFDNVASNSRLQIDANTINLLATDLTTHQGIIFSNVVPTIQFTGSVNNLIYNTTSLQSLFSIPVNSATGGFYINGFLE